MKRKSIQFIVKNGKLCYFLNRQLKTTGMTKVCLIICLLIFQLSAYSQHLIGLNKDQITDEMKKTDYVLDNSSVNTTYKYLKYIDKFNDQTMLVFLSESDVCTSTKLMSDYSNLEIVKSLLNKNYKSAGKDKWKYSIAGVEYTVVLKREEWYFTVFTSKNEK
jgi:hypothetical protein